LLVAAEVDVVLLVAVAQAGCYQAQKLLTQLFLTQLLLVLVVLVLQIQA
jgi:hypothetical protein